MTVFVSLALFVALLAAPGGFDSPFSGAPLAGLSRVLLVGGMALAGFAAIFRTARALPVKVPVILASLLLAKVAVGYADVPVGWKGVYEMIDRPPTATGKFFSRFRAHDFRIDRAIDFDGQNLGAYFLNDPVRYGFLYSPKTRDFEYPLRISWTGYVTLPSAQALTVFVKPRGRVALAIDGRQALDSTDEHAVSTTPPLTAGSHMVTVVYEKPPDALPLIRVVVTDVGKTTALRVTPSPESTSTAWRRSLLAVLTTLFAGAGAVILFVAVAGSFLPRGPVGLVPRHGKASAALAAYVVFLVLTGAAWYGARSYTGITVHLWTGDDPLIYEGNARDVMMNGLLMPEGYEVGRGRPYFFYPLYSYVLAGTHWVAGEDFSTVVLFNGLCVASLPLLLWALGWRDLPWWAAWPAMIALGVFCRVEVSPYTLTAYTDTLFISLTFVTLIAARRTLESGGVGLALTAGALSALTAAARPSFMTFVPMLATAVLVGVTIVRSPRRVRVAGALVLGFAIGLAPFAVRNYVVSRQFVLLVNSWIQLPYFLNPPERPNPVGFTPGKPPPTFRESVAWAASIVRQDPAQAAVIEGRKLAFTLGLTQFGPTSVGAHPEFVAITVLGVFALWRRRGPPGLRSTILVYSAAHVAAMLLAAPWTYGYKSILPLQIAWLCLAGFLLVPAGVGATPPQSSEA